MTLTDTGPLVALLDVDDGYYYQAERREVRDVRRLVLDLTDVRAATRGATGQRHSPLTKLSPDEIDRLTQEFTEIGGNPAKLRFNEGRRTGYLDGLDIIAVRGDVLPLEGMAHPRSAMSSRAVLAHEFGHQRYRGTSVPAGAWNDEFRASYWAAKYVPNLTREERVHLIQDAILRAQEVGIPVRLNAFMRRLLYGY